MVDSVYHKMAKALLSPSKKKLSSSQEEEEVFLSPPEKSDKLTDSNEQLSQTFIQGIKKLDWSWFHGSEAREKFQSFNRSVMRRFSEEDVSSSARKNLSSLKSVTFESDSEVEKAVRSVIRADSDPATNSSTRRESFFFAPFLFPSTPPRPPPPVIPSTSEKITQCNTHTQTSTEVASPVRRTMQDGPCPVCYQQLQDFKLRFTRARSHKEKYEILTSVPVQLVPDGNLSKEFSCSDLIAYGAAALRASQGAFSSPPPQFVQHIPEFVKSIIASFFKDPQNGGEMKGRENVFEDGKLKRQKQAMFISLSQLYQEFISAYAGTYRSVTISRFAYLTPSYIVWSRRFFGNSHGICLLHENLHLLLSACTTYYFEGIFRVLSTVVCSDKECSCMLGYCDRCPIERSINALVGDYSFEELVEFYNWQDMGDNNIVMTLVSEPVPQFTTKLDMTIKQFLKHHFISTSQREYLNHINSYLSKSRSTVLVKMDFCEPYTVVSKIGSKKASKFFNYDPQKVISIYPFAIKYFDEDRGVIETRYIVVISNDLRDSATSAYFFQAEMIKWLKHSLPYVKNIIYFTDDNPNHHKNAEMIFNLLYHEEDYNLKASLEYTVEGHDLDEVGLLATRIKRECRLASLKGKAVINSAEDMFLFCRKEMTRYDLQFCYVDRFSSRIRNVEVRLLRRYKLNGGIIPGIRHFYSYQPDYVTDGNALFKSDTIRVRRYSLSRVYHVVKVTMSSSSIASIDDFIYHSVTSYTHPYDVGKLVVGNIVTVNLEGQIYTGRVSADGQVRIGELGVVLKGKVETGKGGKCMHVPLQDDVPVDISTLDVLMVEDAGAEKMIKKKEQQQQCLGVDEKKGWKGRSISPGRFLGIRKKDK